VNKIQTLASSISSDKPDVDNTSDAVVTTSQWDVVALTKNELSLLSSTYSRSESIHRQSALQNMELCAMVLLAMLNVCIHSVVYIILLISNLYFKNSGLYIEWEIKLQSPFRSVCYISSGYIFNSI